MPNQCITTPGRNDPLKKFPPPKLFKSTLHRSPSPKLRYIIFERLYMWTLSFTIWRAECPKAIIIRCRTMRPLLCIICSIYSQIFCAWAFGHTFQLILDGAVGGAPALSACARGNWLIGYDWLLHYPPLSRVVDHRTLVNTITKVCVAKMTHKYIYRPLRPTIDLCGL